MSKTQASPHDDVGKDLGSLKGKNAGALDKDALGSDAEGMPEPPDYDNSSYGSHSSGGSSDGSDSDGSDSGDSSSSTDGNTDTDSGSDDDDSALYVEGEADDAGDSGDPDTGVLDHDNETPPEPPPDERIPPNNRVSIDIEAMTRLVAAMERAGDRIAAVQDEMRSILSGVHLDTSPTSRFDQVSAWVEDQLPTLRRRLALAQDLESGTGNTRPDDQRPPVYLPYVGDEFRVPDCPPGESYENGRETAQRFTVQPDHQNTADLIARLRSNQHDPYFAREFVHNADPDRVVTTVLRATSDPQAAPAESEQLIALTASTMATGSRGTGQLAPPDDYEEQWAAMRDGDDARSSLAARLRPAASE